MRGGISRRVADGRAKLGIDHCGDNCRGIRVAVGREVFYTAPLGIIIAYTLNPLVVWMERAKIPRVIGTIIVMLSVLCGSTFVTISLRGQIQTILDQLPDAASQLSVSLRNMRGGGSPLPCRKCKPRRKRLIRQPVRRRMSPRHPNSLRPMSSLTSPPSSWATT